jgi:glucan phosphoethanolaminetransferase (alkaline phosphatase superfamily)
MISKGKENIFKARLSFTVVAMVLACALWLYMLYYSRMVTLSLKKSGVPDAWFDNVPEIIAVVGIAVSSILPLALMRKGRFRLALIVAALSVITAALVLSIAGAAGGVPA